MNTIIKKGIWIIAASTLVATGCNDLELGESQYHSKTYQFSDFDKVKQVMTNVYGYLQSDFASVGGTMIDCASDDAVFTSPTDSIKTYFDGSWSSSNLIDDRWGHLYSGIRAANYLLENCPEDFPDSKYNDDYSRNIAQLKNYPWEARALRAYFHFELLKRYGNIVIADHTYTKEEVGTLTQKTFDESANWIASELKEAAEHLPDTYSGTYFAEIGRVTKGFALAIRSRVLLYAASPLNNPTEDKKKWEKAAAAAKELLDHNDKTNVYKLSDFAASPNGENKGVIFCIREAASGNFEKSNFPVGYEDGQSGICPSLNLVEAFDMKTGEPFDHEKHKEALLDPSQRDPRLAKCILTNGDSFKGEIIETFIGGKNGQPLTNATPTSFYLKKFIIENTSLTTGNIRTYPHIYPVVRLAEVYLNYAEALFEATQNPEFKGKIGNIDYHISPLEAVAKVRETAGMDGFTETDPDDFSARLRNERRVELCFEGHRFWDIRRWKTGKDTRTIYGLEITKSGEKDYDIKKITVQQRNWHDKMNFYPISDIELHKNSNLRQNIGW